MKKTYLDVIAFTNLPFSASTFAVIHHVLIPLGLHLSPLHGRAKLFMTSITFTSLLRKLLHDRVQPWWHCNGSLSEIRYYWVFYMEFHRFIIILTVTKTPVTHQLQLFITKLLDWSAKITFYFISTAGGRQLEVWLNNLSLMICPNIPLRTSVVILQESVVALDSLSSDFLSDPSLPMT